MKTAQAWMVVRHPIQSVGGVVLEFARNGFLIAITRLPTHSTSRLWSISGRLVKNAFGNSRENALHIPLEFRQLIRPGTLGRRQWGQCCPIHIQAYGIINVSFVREAEQILAR